LMLSRDDDAARKDDRAVLLYLSDVGLGPGEEEVLDVGLELLQAVTLEHHLAGAFGVARLEEALLEDVESRELYRVREVEDAVKVNRTIEQRRAGHEQRVLHALVRQVALKRSLLLGACHACDRL